MAIVSLRSVVAKIVLNDGTDSHGNTKYVRETLPNLSEEDYDADAILAIVTGVAPCLSKTVANIEELKTSYISAA